MFKKAISGILAIVLILASIPMVMVSASESTLPQNMLHVKTLTASNENELSQSAKVTPGETYYFSFCLSSDINFTPICRTNGERVGVSANITQISKGTKGKVSFYTYSYTIPETDNNGNAMTETVFFGIRLSEIYEGFFFDASVYNAADESKTELLTNPDFASGVLDKWVLKWSTFGTGNTSFSNDNAELKVVAFDESILAENEEFSKMLHINYSSYSTSNNQNELYQRANVIAGETYYFSFALSSGVEFTPICRADVNRPSISAEIAQISKSDKGDISIYTYSYTLPTTDDVTDLVFFGIRFSSAFDGYFFDASVKSADDAYGFEYLENPDFSDGTMNKWALGWEKWFSSSDSEWSNDMAQLEVVDFDSSLLNPAPEKMLYIKTTSANKELYQRVVVEVGKTYYFEFALNSETAFTPVCRTDDKRVNVEANITLVRSEVTGNCTKYVYSYTIPETDTNGNTMSESVFFGIRLTSACETYFFDISLYDPEDKYELEMLENPDFSSGVLDRWAFGWDIWFAPSVHSTSNVGISEWTDSSSTLKVMDYNPDLTKYMLYVRYESVDMQGECLIQPIDSIEADTEYTVSFNYYFASGSLDGTVDFALMGDPLDADSVVERLIQSSAESTYLTSSSDDGVNVTYTFTLDSETVESYQGFYAGFYFKISPRIVTEFYISDFVIYKSDDADKTSLFVKDSFEDMYGWYSNWKKADEGSDTFGWDTVDYLDYLAQYVPYDAELFVKENAVVHYGDANFDGEIDLRDLVAMKKNIANLGDYLSSYDCNSDDKISADDLTIVRMHLIGKESIVWEDSGKSSLQAVSNLSGGADSEAQTLKTAIGSASDTLLTTAEGNIYYVSENGEYDNDGLSKENPVNIEKLRELSLSSGDIVLFNRGETYRISSTLNLVSGVSYGAYGSGDKPIISGSLKDYADKVLWTTEDGFIWQTAVTASDVGNIVFNGGEYVGFKKSTLAEADSDGDFWYDSENQVLYLYLRQINPANYFNSIEISSVGTLISRNGTSKNITIENLTLKYASVHGINLYNSTNVTISGCELGWIGGGYSSSGSRYGNAIQFWDYASGCEVINNYIYQVYDAALTFQGNDASSYTDLTYKNNLVEYTSMNFEFWDSETATISNIDFSDNILRFAGYGFSAYQRTARENQAYILAWNNTYEDGCISNFNITDNIFDMANCYFFYATGCIDSLGISGNTYYQNAESIYSIKAGTTVYATDSSVFEETIKSVDSEATIYWLG